MGTTRRTSLLSFGRVLFGAVETGAGVGLGVAVAVAEGV